MKKKLFIILAVAYAVLLVLTLNHNSISMEPVNVPQYIGRNSLTKK